MAAVYTIRAPHSTQLNGPMQERFTHLRKIQFWRFATPFHA
ncbi:hypothetical protein AC519_0597 [Pseudomonas savastanoi]|nr:hypothetical protein AC519_0597 [Pseudomonas savastanoi]